MEPTSNSRENTNFALASGVDLGQLSEASTRIDAVATQPVFGDMCHQLIRSAECVGNGPIADLAHLLRLDPMPGLVG